MADRHLVVLSGSLRKQSVNTVVARALLAQLPSGFTGQLVDLRPLPMFDQDLEGAGDPRAVTGLKQAVLDAHGIIMVTPEYNVGVPAVAKNAVDWLSRPYGNGPITGRAAGIISASPGSRGGIGARAHLADSLGVLTEHLFGDTLGLARVGDDIEDGRLGGASLDNLVAWLQRFCAHTSATT